MQPSRYNIMIPNEPSPSSGMLIFNTLSGSLFELEPAYHQSLEALQDGADLSEKDLKRLAEMAVEGYVVEDEESENAMVINRLRSATYAPSPTVRAMVVTTMACNLACRYSFESGMDKIPSMDIEMAQMVFERIRERVEATSAQEIDIDYYGGEPLLNMEVIKFLSERLKAWFAENNKLYSFSLTTNGTLLTHEIVETMLPLGLVKVRVTVDGVKDTHDARRPFRRGKGSSFKTIMKNLRGVVDVLQVTLVHVYSEETIEQLPACLEELEDQGILNKLASIQAGTEQPYLDKKGMVCGSSQCVLTKGSAESFVGAINQLVIRGLSPGSELLQGANSSVATAHGLWVFSADGAIHKCPMLIGKPGLAVGQVGQEKLNGSHYKFATKELWQQCLRDTDCPYVPMCGAGAGCRYAALMDAGDLWGEACSREFLDHYVPEVMRLEYIRKCEEA